jgi:hypothetical protein
MSKKAETVKMVLVGDVFPKSHASLDLMRPTLKGADITFGQLELLMSRRGTPQAFDSDSELNRRPGAPAPEPPRVPGDPDQMLQVVADGGFNVMSFASNHTYSQSDEGVIDTLAALKSRNIACVGAGKDINEATKPAILEKKGQKIGFLAYCSVVPPGGWATSDKAGVAPLRASTSYEQVDWQPGSPPRIISWCNRDDIAGMMDDIRKLKSQVDVVVVSMHWGVHIVPGLIADYQVEGGHAAIDAGADLIIGHHAHILKGIEVYKGKVIFHGLANFCSSPSKKISPVKASGLYWMTKHHIRIQVDPEGHPYYAGSIDAQKTMLVKCDIADKKIQRLSYLPLLLNAQNQPEVLSHIDKRSDEHFRYVQWLCGGQGLDTHLVREGDEVVIKP